MARGVCGHFSTLRCGPIASACTSRAAAKHELQPNLGPISPNLDTKNLLLQAVGASSISSLRTTTPHGGGGELGVGGSARCAGAYDRTRVRTRVNARAWQGLRRRFKAPCHRLAALNTQESEGGSGTGWRLKEGRVGRIDFFFAAPGQNNGLGSTSGTS